MDASSTHQDSLPVSSDALLQEMRAAGIAFELYHHVPLRTVEEARAVQGGAVPTGPGRCDVKNFFLRDRKKRNYLVTLEQDRKVDLATLGAAIGAGKPSFGSPDRLMQALGVRPGAVSPLAMRTGAQAGVAFFADVALRDAALIHLHPLVNDRTVALTPAALMRLLETWGAEPRWLTPESFAG